MNYKKMFFPVGGGEELQERLYGACLVAKYFHANLEIFKSGHNSNIELYKNLELPKQITSQIDELFDTKFQEENVIYQNLLSKISDRLGISYEDETNPLPSLTLKIQKGCRSTLVEQESKFCDIVIAAAPPSGIATSTFETAVMKSGKPVIMIPRKMKEFSTKSVIIGWNNSPEVSRALAFSMDILEKADRVHIISSKEYTTNIKIMENLISYLAEHNIDATYEIVETTNTPGETLLNCALDGDFDLIVAGAYGYKGLRELMFGGATKYLLLNSTLPVFMSY